MNRHYISTFATPSDIIFNYRDDPEPKYDLSKDMLRVILRESVDYAFPCGHVEKGAIVSNDKEWYFINALFDQVSSIASDELGIKPGIIKYNTTWDMYRLCEVITGLLFLIDIPYKLIIAPYHNSSTERTIKIKICNFTHVKED